MKAAPESAGIRPEAEPDSPAEDRADRLPVWRDSGEPLQVNEIFWSIEGEGVRVGEPTTFVRLSRCNLRCPFCDTDFDRYEEMTIAEIAAVVAAQPARWVCLTGGEPLAQNLVPLAQHLASAGYRLHLETNGTLSPDPRLFDLIEHWTVSPKRFPMAPGFDCITELKYVVGRSFREEIVEESRAQWIYLQPESSEPRYVDRALEILKRHPHWRLSCRVHKWLGLR